MVQRAADGEAYRLGPELFGLASRILGSGELRLAGRAELHALARATRETATLEVLVGDHVLIVEEAVGGHMVGAMPSTGTRWPAHATSTGKVLLAELPEPERESFLEGALPSLTPKTITDAQALRRELARVRERGYAIASEELEPGFVAAGAAVRSADGRAIAAIGVGGPKARLSADRLLALARQLPAAAGRVSARLGFRPPDKARASAR
jgi:DNA-binding IclR family transcriptional regulator